MDAWMYIHMYVQADIVKIGLLRRSHAVAEARADTHPSAIEGCEK